MGTLSAFSYGATTSTESWIFLLTKMIKDAPVEPVLCSERITQRCRRRGGVPDPQGKAVSAKDAVAIEDAESIAPPQGAGMKLLGEFGRERALARPAHRPREIEQSASRRCVSGIDQVDHLLPELLIELVSPGYKSTGFAPPRAQLGAQGSCRRGEGTAIGGGPAHRGDIGAIASAFRLPSHDDERRMPVDNARLYLFLEGKAKIVEAQARGPNRFVELEIRIANLDRLVMDDRSELDRMNGPAAMRAATVLGDDQIRPRTAPGLSIGDRDAERGEPIAAFARLRDDQPVLVPLPRIPPLRLLD